MIRVITLCVTGISKEIEKLCSELYERYKDKIPKEFQASSVYRGGQLCLRLLPDSPELKEAMEFAELHNMEPHYFSRVAFSPKETREAPFFHLQYVPYPLELEGTNLSDYGTQYTGGCPICGLGKKAIGDVFVDRKFIKKYQMGNLSREYFVSERVRDLLENSGLTGFHIGQQIKDYKGREMPPYYILEIDSILPPLSESTWIEPAGLEPCGHPWTLYNRSDLQYEKEKLTNAKDFNCTQEELNNYHTHEIIVSAKARAFFKEHKIYARFVPLTIL